MSDDVKDSESEFFRVLFSKIKEKFLEIQISSNFTRFSIERTCQNSDIRRKTVKWQIGKTVHKWVRICSYNCRPHLKIGLFESFRLLIFCFCFCFSGKTNFFPYYWLKFGKKKIFFSNFQMTSRLLNLVFKLEISRAFIWASGLFFSPRTGSKGLMWAELCSVENGVNSNFLISTPTSSNHNSA